MGVKLNKETSDVIHVSQMKDGQIAEIINWNTNQLELIGEVVKRVEKDVVFIGINFIFYNVSNEELYDNKCQVRILKNGETLTITDNE